MKKLAIIYAVILFSFPTFAQLAGTMSVGEADAQFLGESAGDLAGHHVAIIHDIDGDNYDELVVTAPGRDLNAESADNGAVYLFYGRPEGFSGSIDLASADAIWTGDLTGQEAAHDVFGIGDIDNDGFNDFAVGLKKHNTLDDSTKGGKIYLFFGSSSRFSGEKSLETADASIVGTRAFAEAAHVYGAGDLDADGYSDFIVGAGFDSQVGAEAGKVYVFFGKERAKWSTNMSMEDSCDASFLAESAGDWAGHRVAGVGDVNGDGKSDFIVGANRYNSGELNNLGKVYLILGKSRDQWQKDVSLSQADASWIGQSNVQLGWNVATAGDADGDGRPDLLLGQKKAKYFLILAKSISYAQNQDVESAADVAFSPSVVLTDNIGHDNTTLGDINKDGIDDFFIGASAADDATAGVRAGKGYVFYGRSSWPAALALDDADAILTGEHAEDNAAFSASGTGDINHDGVNDFLLSAPHNDDAGIDAGKVYLFLNATPVLTLLSPNGGESFYPGESHTITWLTDPNVDQVTLEFSDDNGATWSLIADNIDDTGSYMWTVPTAISDSCLVKISDAADGDPSDTSNSVFSISTNAFIRVTAPNGGESLAAGSTFNITWTSQDVPGQVKIELSVDGGITWDVIAADAANTGSYSWSVPDRASTNCLVRIAASPNIGLQDESDAFFAITGSAYQVDRTEAENAILSEGYIAEDRDESSNGKVARLTNSASNGTIRYNFALVPGKYQLFVRYSDEIDGACQSVLKIEGRTVDQWTWDMAVSSDINVYRRIGSFNFNLGDEISLWTLRDDGEYARVDYLEFKSSGLPADYLTLTSPNGGEKWFVGSQQSITWAAAGTSGLVDIDISRDSGASWESIAASIPGEGLRSYTWTVTSPVSEQCLVRVRDVDGSPADISDATFSIAEQVIPSVTVTSPNGGETWVTGDQQTITWTSEHTSGAVKIELSRDGGAAWETLAADTPDDGSFDWVATAPASDSCLVRVADVTESAADSSDALFSIVEPEITVLTPNGGEIWNIGTTEQIIWKAMHVSSPVNVELSRDGGATWELLASDLTVTPDEAGNSQMSWLVVGEESDSCLVRVSATDASAMDQSDETFTITSPPSITVITPNGGEVWRIGEQHDISWSSNKIQGEVKIELSRDNGATFSTLTESTPNDGLLQWTVTGPTSAECLVRISASDGSVNDVSDQPFSVIPSPQLTVIAPNGGESWIIGTLETIRWNSVSTSGNVKIELSRDGGGSWEMISESTADDGTFDWTITLPASQNCIIQISDVEGLASDRSDGVFTIKNPPEPVITLVQPNGGEEWYIGQEQLIKWFSKDIESAVRIEISRDEGATWATIADSAVMQQDESGISQLAWTVTGPAANGCLMRVSALDATAEDISDAAFRISRQPSITITAPNGGERWQVGSTESITWESVNVAQVRIELSLDGGTKWMDIVASTDNPGRYDWLVTEPVSDSALVRITDVNGAAVDTSDSLFAIIPAPQLQILSPNGGEQLQIGTETTIRWSSINTSGWISIELTRDNGATWEMLADSTRDSGEFKWMVNGPVSGTCLIRIADVAGLPLDVSDGHFSIVEQPSLTVTSPAAEDVWHVGSEYTITWEWTNLGSQIKIELSRDGGSTWEILAEKAPNTGSWSWTVTEPISEDCYIRLSDPATGISDQNDGAFAIKYPTGVARLSSEIPDEFALLQNYPNPFNPETRITYQLAAQADVLLQVYNLQGALVATLIEESQAAGTYMITWRGLNDSGQPLPTGVYFYRIKAGDFRAIKRMTYIK